MCGTWDGTDSLVVHIEHYLSMSVSDPLARVRLMTLPLGDFNIYSETSFYPGGSVNDHEPIHWSSQSNLQGTWVGISFYAFKEELEMGNSVSWYLYSLTITAHGVNTGLKRYIITGVNATLLII